MNPLLPNTIAPAVPAFARLMVQGIAHFQRVDVIDFYRSPAMDENLQKAAAQPPTDPEKTILERVLDYGAACRVHGVGPEVTEAYKAVVEAVRGVAA